MDLTMCGLLVERAEELAQLYREKGNWNDVKQAWFDERLSSRSTRNSAQKLYRVLSSRLKNAPSSLPNASDLPLILDECTTKRDKAQVLFLYLVTDDPLVQYVVHAYANRVASGRDGALDFSNETLGGILEDLEYADGSPFEYAESTMTRWCEGFRSVMREIGVIENQQAVAGKPPSVSDVPLLVAMGYSYSADSDEERWFDTPIGLLYLFQPEDRWLELFDRVAATETWEFVELHGELRLSPNDGPYAWVDNGGVA
ncbi:BrxA family protein [Natronobeatus ordinarius]|uniref:BrxA family protein n=1 Tax=Natronobeatus ordinarius TaxID=2963433 RepID=UPI0020CD5186|nr:BrxA family protein [Natronobeatus ordinarius]